jgi:hypothetical protein
MQPRRLVTFVEGYGEEDAVPSLVNHLLLGHEPWDCVLPDYEPFRVGQLGSLIKDEGKKWIDKLKVAAKTRKNLGGVLLIADGDLDLLHGQPFCAMKAAQHLSQLARQAGGGSFFSVAIVIALQEYESWLIAGVEWLAGKTYPDGRPGIQRDAVSPSGNLEEAPRDAKKWLSSHMNEGYKPTVDQGPLTRLLLKEDLTLVRQRMRSFRRLEHAIQVLVDACRSGRHVVSPEPPLPR